MVFVTKSFIGPSTLAVKSYLILRNRVESSLTYRSDRGEWAKTKTAACRAENLNTVDGSGGRTWTPRQKTSQRCCRRSTLCCPAGCYYCCSGRRWCVWVSPTCSWTHSDTAPTCSGSSRLSGSRVSCTLWNLLESNKNQHYFSFSRLLLARR